MLQWLTPQEAEKGLPTDASLRGKRVTVMGLGRFGGGLGVAQWLLDRGAMLTITDLEPAERLAASVATLRAHPQFANARLVLGSHDVSDFTACELVVANVAVPKPWENRFLVAAKAAGVPITTEIALTIDRLRTHRRTIGITGTVGKSTTTAMVHHAISTVLPTSQRALLGGNIGGSLLPELAALREHDWVVLELSSAQLWWLSQLLTGERAWNPHIACLTTFADNHGDWHGGIAHYHASKAQLFSHQRAEDIAIFGPALVGEAPAGRGFRARPGVRTVVANAADFTRTMTLPGTHNQLNASLAQAIVQAAEPALAARSAEAIASFRGLAHRLQLVGEVRGVRYYNDSKSTTPQATLTALAALRDAGCGGIHLIAGGYDKHSDLSSISQEAPRLAGLWGIGATGGTIVEAASHASAKYAGTLDRALASIAGHARAGEAVLLSPGCASWDQFENFEQRGEAFVELVRAVQAGAI